MKIDMNNLNAIKPLRAGMPTAQQQVESAEEVRDTFRQFVGEAFFGQMLKSMRSTQDKAAYFHGGHGEEVFQGQLDQVLSEEMTESSADQIADPMFRQQFPAQAAVLARHEVGLKPSIEDLTSLRRW